MIYSKIDTEIAEIPCAETKLLHSSDLWNLGDVTATSTSVNSNALKILFDSFRQTLPIWIGLIWN